MTHSESDMTLYNSLHNRISKFGIDLSLYREEFYPRDKQLMFFHKYHHGWVISVNSLEGIRVYENFYE